jgi:two-component system, OmpR family, response regulator
LSAAGRRQFKGCAPPMRVLLVEDDRQTSDYVRIGLSGGGWDVAVAADGLDALEQARRATFDVLIIDRMLPGLDGLSLLRRLRADDVRTPTLFLTAMGAIADRVAGLECGDDYLVKPFSMAELSARVSALARRPAATEAVVLRAGDIIVDRISREVRRGDQSIDLLPLQYRLLEVLMLHGGRPVTRTMLLERVWGLRFDPRTNIVETHVSHLRAKLDAPGEPSPIVTVRGEGYAIRAA